MKCKEGNQLETGKSL